MVEELKTKRQTKEYSFPVQRLTKIQPKVDKKAFTTDGLMAYT